MDQGVEISINHLVQPSESAKAYDPPKTVLSFTVPLAPLDNDGDQIEKAFSVSQINTTRTGMRQSMQWLYERAGLDFGHTLEQQVALLGLVAQAVDNNESHSRPGLSTGLPETPQAPEPVVSRLILPTILDRRVRPTRYGVSVDATHETPGHLFPLSLATGGPCVLRPESTISVILERSRSTTSCRSAARSRVSSRSVLRSYSSKWGSPGLVSTKRGCRLPPEPRIMFSFHLPSRIAKCPEAE